MSLKWLKTAAIAALLAGYAVAPKAAANIFYRDDRVQLTPKMGEEIAKIGHLTNSIDGSRGTAFLVGRCHILTNFHVAFSNEAAPDIHEESYFVLGQDKPIVARPVAHGEFVPAEPLTSADDWALLELEDCAGDRYGWLELVGMNHESASNTSLTLSAAGFPSDHDLREITLDPSCRIYPDFLKESREWAHDCATREGSSGSPIFFKDASGQWKVVAIVSSTRGGLYDVFSSWSLAWGNGSVPIESFLDRVRPYLAP